MSSRQGRDATDAAVAARQCGFAWVGLVVAIAVHVADEALTDFLSVYNPIAQTVRAQLPWLPLPTFTFESWLTGLIFGIGILFCLSPFAFLGSRGMRPLYFFLGFAMTDNAFGHILGSISLGRPMPGAYSSPLLLAAALWLLWQMVEKKPAAD